MRTNERAPLPARRPVSITPFRHASGQVYFELRDMLGIAPRPIIISTGAYLVLAHLDGQHTLAELQAQLELHAGQRFPDDDIHGLLASLDEALMLDTPRYAAAAQAALAAYRSAPARDNRDRWPAASELTEQIAAALASDPGAPAAGLRGLIAPHLDYPRGGPCYAAAYGALRGTPPAERYVILGTNHFGASATAVATAQHFQTPLGLVQTDRDLLGRLQHALDFDLCAGELDHVGEHSVELQVQILQHLYPDASFRIVPLLCPDVCGPSGAAPRDGRGPGLDQIVDALADLLAADGDRTVVIAGADLSHIGTSFGDSAPTTAARLAEVARHDRSVLDLLTDGDQAAFLAAVSAGDNPTRICSAACLLAARRLLADARCEVRHYHQATDAASDTNVTCAAAVLV